MTYKEVSGKYGVSPVTLAKWKKKYVGNRTIVPKYRKRIRTCKAKVGIQKQPNQHVDSSPDKIDEFVIKWIESGNATQAAIDVKLYDDTDELISAGKRHKIALRISSMLRSRPDIKDRRDEVYKIIQLFDNNICSKDNLLAIASDIARNQGTEETVVVVSDGKDEGQHVEKVKKDFSGLTRVKAMELIGHLTGMTDRKVEIGVVPIIIDNIPDTDDDNTIDVTPDKDGGDDHNGL